jgi:hypothetical protein
VTAAPFLPSGNVEKENTGWPEEDVAEAYGTTLPGLEPPPLEVTGGPVTGADTPQHRIENKHRRKALLATQSPKTQWTIYRGEFELPPPKELLATHRGGMCPSGLALHHPAAELLAEWATYGCPTCTGRRWTKEEMQEAVDHGPHHSAMSKEALLTSRQRSRRR